MVEGLRGDAAGGRCRDLKQRLGWEECRAWNRPRSKDQPGPVGDAEPAAVGSVRWRPKAPRIGGSVGPGSGEGTPSVLDVERLLRRHGSEIRNQLAKWLGKEERGREAAARAAGGGERTNGGAARPEKRTSLGIGGK